MRFNLKKREGKIYYSLALFLVMFCALLVVFEIKMNNIKILKNLAEDSIVASNLACLVIDIEQFGRTHDIHIKDVNEIYDIYCKALKGNMKLEDNFTPVSEDIIKGEVKVHRFIVFNVSGNQIIKTEISEGESQSVEIINEQIGIMTTPDGTPISNTTVYSKIGFWIKGFMGYEHYVYKENSVDITCYEKRGD